jgi:3-hydroxyisobutyrate dehydrogenase-like beta-hydroxyacid dehydrogenase
LLTGGRSTNLLATLMATIAFLGLGRMGSGMAVRLCEAGHRVQAYSRNAAQVQKLVGACVQPCATIAQACEGAQAAFSMVSDDAASRAVWLESGGALESSQAASPQVVRNARRMLADDHESHIAFLPTLRLKDTEYALRLARSAGVATPFAELAADTFRALRLAHPGEVNESKVIDVARRRLLRS